MSYKTTLQWVETLPSPIMEDALNKVSETDIQKLLDRLEDRSFTSTISGKGVNIPAML